MVEVFKTSVTEHKDAAAILTMLNSSLPACKINFDLEDCDNILRIKGDCIPVTTIMELLHTSGFECAVLDS